MKVDWHIQLLGDTIEKGPDASIRIGTGQGVLVYLRISSSEGARIDEIRELNWLV